MTPRPACQALGTKSLFTDGGGSYLQALNYSGIEVKLGKELLTKKKNMEKKHKEKSKYFILAFLAFPQKQVEIKIESHL